MKIVDKDFEPRETSSTYDKVRQCIDSMNFLEDDSHDFVLVVTSGLDGYTTVGTNLSPSDSVFILESAKLGLIMGDPEQSENLH